MGAVVKFLLVIQVVFASTGSFSGATTRYAWGENIGWIDFGSGEGAVLVSDTELTGYAWGENIGWISLNCSNTSSCATVNYKVTNTTGGQLDGYAWSENAGWINFDPSQGAEPSINTSTGEITGYAWGENIGWINFSCSNTSTCGTVDFKLTTSWRPPSGGGGGGPAPAPAPAPQPQSPTATVPVRSTQPKTSSQTFPKTSPPSQLAQQNVEPQNPHTANQPTGMPGAIAEKIVNAVSDVASPLVKTIAPIIKKTTRPVSVLSGAGVALSAAASAVSLASSGVSWLSYLEFFLKNILVFFGIKKKTRAWGTVYNSVTKEPLSYARVQLVGKDMRVLETRITDREGRYGFLANEGEFMIIPSREGFQFPSKLVTGSSDTILYSRVYLGGLQQAKPNEVIKFDIPLDPVSDTATAVTKLPSIRLHNFLAKASRVFFWIALVTVPLTYILHPNLINLVMLILFAGLNLLVWAGDLQQRPYGLVVDRDHGGPVPYSMITLNDKSNQRKGFTVSDNQGRYFLLSEKGTYDLNVFTPSNINPPRTVKEPLSTDLGCIAKKLNL